MSYDKDPAVAGGSEAHELIRLLHNQPAGPLRDQLIESIKQTVPEALRSPTSAPIEEEINLLTKGVPPFIRLPKPGMRCPHTGLSRTGLVELIAPCERNDHTSPVKAIYKRSHPRAKRGVWQIPTRNLFRYLLQQTDKAGQGYLAMRETRQYQA